MLIRRTFRVLMVAAAVVPAAGAATAQMYPGQDVVVDPNAIPHSQLLQPGQPYPGFVLKPPARHRPHHRAVAKTTPPADPATTASADTEAPPPADTSVPKDAPPPSPPPPKHKARVVKEDAVTGSATASGNAVPFSLGEDEPLGAPATPPPDKTSKPTPPPARVAKAEQPQPTTPADSGDAAGLAKRGAILFEHSAMDPQPSQLDGIKLLAGDLASALEAGATQIQLQAFGGARGDKSSDARRISLRRALAIRQLLIDNGVPASRIVTRAMGGVTDSGSPDRVDIYIRSI